MADVEYYGNAQFEPLLEQRDHDDKYSSEIIRVGDEFNRDYAEMMVDDILMGNTHTISRYYRKQFDTQFQVGIINGTTHPDVSLNHGPILDHSFFAITPIKDDYSTAQGEESYANLPKEDERRQDVNKLLNSLKMDWEDITNEIIDPEEIPEIGTQGWKKYQKMWDDSEELQAEYPDINNYRTHIVIDRQQQQQSKEDITDMYMGIHATGDTISEANTIAMYYTAAHIYPLITYNGINPPDITDYPPHSYMYEFGSGSFLAVNGWASWSHIIRSGIVANKFDEGAPQWSRAKSSHRFLYGNNAQLDAVDGDPIVQILQANVLEGDLIHAASGVLEIQVQLDRTTYGEIRIWDYGTIHVITDDSGRVTTITGSIANGSGDTTDLPEDKYPEELSIAVADGATNIYEFTPGGTGDSNNYEMDPSGDGGAFAITSAYGHITAVAPLDYASRDVWYFKVNVTDSEANSTTVKFTVTVNNTNSEPEPPPHEDPYPPEEDDDEIDKGPNIIFFPLEYKSTKKIPVFKRERFLRESVQLSLFIVTEVEIAWYQKKWFQVVIFIIAVIVAVVSGPLGWAGMLSFETVVTTAFNLVVLSLVSKAVMSGLASDSALLKILIIVAMAYGSYTNISLVLDNAIALATQAMNAAGTAVQIYYQEKMMKLQEEMLEFAAKVASEQEELDRLTKEAGGLNRSDASDLTLQLAQHSLAFESPEHYQDKTTNIDNAIINDVDYLSDVTTMWPDMIK